MALFGNTVAIDATRQGHASMSLTWPVSSYGRRHRGRQPHEVTRTMSRHRNQDYALWANEFKSLLDIAEAWSESMGESASELLGSVSSDVAWFLVSMIMKECISVALNYPASVVFYQGIPGELIWIHLRKVTLYSNSWYTFSKRPGSAVTWPFS